MLRVDQVRKRLGGRRVVDEVSFTCAAGQTTVLTGHNGAGKSTLLKMIAGIMEPDAGSIEIGGQALGSRPMEARKRLGYVPEAANPPGHMTGTELFGLVRALKRAEPLSGSLYQALGLEPIARVRIERLSLGERRRVCLGAALIGEPLVLVLDEPTNGLDAGGVDTLAALLGARRDAGAAILLATHDSAFAESLADARLRMQDGRLVP
jgi:ABC-type multidrug transport system ATPase subunit